MYALIGRRAALTRSLGHHERMAARCRADLAVLDAALLLFEPDQIEATTIHQRSPYFPKGGVSRLCLGAMRVSSGPISAHEIAERAMIDRGLDPTDTALKAHFVRRVQWALNGLRRRGAVVPHGGYRDVRWELAGRQS